jgi:hypothetical protein
MFEGYFTSIDHERAYCEAVGDTWNNGKSEWFKGPLYESVRDLMLAGFCLLLCCSQSFGQFTVSVEQSFTVEVDAVTSDDSATPSGRYLVKFTADWCGTCRVFDATQMPKLKAAGITPTVIDSTNGNTWGVTSLPEFWIVDRATGQPIEKVTGYTKAEDLLQKLNDQQAFEATKPIQGRLEVPAPAQKQDYVSQLMSHSEMVSLHNRLYGGGLWTWPGDLASHLATTHNVSTVKAANTSTKTTVRYQQQSACPGGRCPVPTQRRIGWFGRWRR